jgi:hypothetical protein
VFLAADERRNLVGLKLGNRERSYFSIIEPATTMGGLFEPSSDVIPGDLLTRGMAGNWLVNGSGGVLPTIGNSRRYILAMSERNEIGFGRYEFPRLSLCANNSETPACL